MTEKPRDPDPAPVFGDLRSEDAAAVDALIGASFDPAHAIRTLPGGRERIENLRGLLSLLDCDADTDRSLADVTFARLMQARGERLGEAPRETTLSPDDDSALERLVMAGFDSTRVPSTLRERARRHQRLMEMVTRAPIESINGLADRTLARVQSHIDAQAGLLRIETRRPRGFNFRFRLADLVSVAAVLLIGAGVILPVLTAMRDQSRRTLCLSNLGTTAGAMSTYASSNRDSLPMATASLAGVPFWQISPSKPTSNSANLFTLTREGYVPLQALACPGNPKACMTAKAGACDWGCLDEISYSYQIMFGSQRPQWRKGDAVVLADRSPVILLAVRNQPIDPFANSPNHRGSGEHLLHNDGTVTWATSPVLKSGDNIWFPRSIETIINKLVSRSRTVENPLKGSETPDGADDTFLGP